jgi:uncharacterized protein with HEPN domain
MRDAANDIASFTAGKSAHDFLASKQLRWCVERGFEIIGEAMSQLNKSDPATAELVSEHRKIISFRNVLIHGYSQVNNQTTWDSFRRICLSCEKS